MHLEPDKKYQFKWLLSIAKNKYVNYIDYFQNNIEFIHNDEFKNMCNIRREEMVSSALDRWMILRENNVSIVDYLLNNGIHRVLLYGMGNIANRLIWECKEGNIIIEGIIDKSNRNTTDEMKLYKINDDLPCVDAIIVTAIYHLNDICKEIREKIKLL